MEYEGTPPRCVCVNAVDKGVSERFGVKAVDKGLRREIDGKAANKGVRRTLIVDSLGLKAGAGNPELCAGMGKRSRWRAGDCMLPFFGREVEVCGRGELSGAMPRRFHGWQPEAQL